jgi:GDP-L-fucose synthase
VPALLESERNFHRRGLSQVPDYDSAVSDFYSSKRVLVTGGAGFLGSCVCARLDSLGAKEVFVPRSRDYDLRDEAAVRRLFVDSRPDLVVHLAARVGGIGANMAHPAELYLDNLLMGTYVIEEARRANIPKTLVVGTACSYPKLAPAPFRETSLWDGYPEETNAPYGLAKRALIAHAGANRAQYGQNVVFVIPTNLYGPGDKFHPGVSHVIPALIKKFVDATERQDDIVDVWGTGSATREFLYVDDCADGIILAAEHYESTEPVNLGSGREIPISELAGLLAKLTGFEGELRWDATKPDGQPRRLLDVTKARESFGWHAETRLEDGLKKTIDWYGANRAEAEAATF